MIEVSEIKIKRIAPKDGLVGFASCVLNGDFFVGNIAIFESRNGHRITYPTKVVRTLTANISEHVFKPIKPEAGNIIEAAIINAFKSMTNT